MTRQRALILRIIQTANRHLTAEDIFLLAKEEMPSIVRATIYNNLNALTYQGLIRRVRIHEQPDRYDPTLTPHDHLLCDRCGKLSDLFLGDLLHTFEEQSGIKLTGYDLNLHYICPDCREKEGISSTDLAADGAKNRKD